MYCAMRTVTQQVDTLHTLLTGVIINLKWHVLQNGPLWLQYNAVYNFTVAKSLKFSNTYYYGMFSTQPLCWALVHQNWKHCTKKYKEILYGKVKCCLHGKLLNACNKLMLDCQSNQITIYRSTEGVQKKKVICKNL